MPKEEYIGGKNLQEMLVAQQAVLDQHKNPLSLSFLLVRRALSFRAMTKRYWDARISVAAFTQTRRDV